ncbi:MAG: DNA-deoxyinosine glycosylase [Epulopiscium sp. Nele67-Bin002]|nr:MAG: DNA-deoxyinosine glycosylase [Epulopiscium sp. Nele67-Bin002]OON92247.1 MAG: DNA-deoxyinosine glycosylase [Epulopiscium sp. Nele67-Bin001]
MLESFNPIINCNSKVLIVGSMPGGMSLEMQQYYAHPQNHFWKILFNLFNEPLCLDYDAKKDLLFRHNVALWDVIKCCEREGSLDSKIKDEVVNDFDWLFNTYPNIDAVFFNGQKAFNIFKKQIGFNFANVEFITLGSTSSAYTIKFDKKLEMWKAILAFL